MESRERTTSFWNTWFGGNRASMRSSERGSQRDSVSTPGERGGSVESSRHSGTDASGASPWATTLRRSRALINHTPLLRHRAAAAAPSGSPAGGRPFRRPAPQESRSRA